MHFTAAISIAGGQGTLSSPRRLGIESAKADFVPFTAAISMAGAHSTNAQRTKRVSHGCRGRFERGRTLRLRFDGAEAPLRVTILVAAKRLGMAR